MKKLLLVLTAVFLLFMCNNVTTLERNGNHVINELGTPALDTLAYVGLNKLDIGNATVTIKEMSYMVVLTQRMRGFNVYAITEQNFPKSYTLYFNPLISEEQFRQSFAHELVHVQQLYKNRLIPISREETIYEGITYSFDDTKYEVRPWEEEARQRQNVLRDQILKRYMELR